MEGFRFTPEALEYEQEKQERLLREAKEEIEGRKMKDAEVAEFLGDMGANLGEMKKQLEEHKAQLKLTKDLEEKKTLKELINELKEQILATEEFGEASKDAEEFTIKG